MNLQVANRELQGTFLFDIARAARTPPSYLMDMLLHPCLTSIPLDPRQRG